MICGNLAFRMGDGELTNQLPAWEILKEMLWEMLWEIKLETAANQMNLYTNLDFSRAY